MFIDIYIIKVFKYIFFKKDISNEKLCLKNNKIVSGTDTKNQDELSTLVEVLTLETH